MWHRVDREVGVLVVRGKCPSPPAQAVGAGGSPGLAPRCAVARPLLEVWGTATSLGCLRTHLHLPPLWEGGHQGRLGHSGSRLPLMPAPGDLQGTEGTGKAGMVGPGLDPGGPAGVELGLAPQEKGTTASTHLLLCWVPTAWQNPGAPEPSPSLRWA